MFSTISHKVVLFDALSSVAVSNYCQVVKTLYRRKCLSVYLGVILAHYPNPVKHSHDVSPEVLPTVILSGTHYFMGSETRRGHGVEGD